MPMAASGPTTPSEERECAESGVRAKGFCRAGRGACTKADLSFPLACPTQPGYRGYVTRRKLFSLRARDWALCFDRRLGHLTSRAKKEEKLLLLPGFSPFSHSTFYTFSQIRMGTDRLDRSSAPSPAYRRPTFLHQVSMRGQSR